VKFENLDNRAVRLKNKAGFLLYCLNEINTSFIFLCGVNRSWGWGTIVGIVIRIEAGRSRD
jgi:hypothetical protein